MTSKETQERTKLERTLQSGQGWRCNLKQSDVKWLCQGCNLSLEAEKGQLPENHTGKDSSENVNPAGRLSGDLAVTGHRGVREREGHFQLRVQRGFVHVKLRLLQLGLGELCL